MTFSKHTRTILLFSLISTLFYCFSTMMDLAPSTIVRPLMASFHLKGSTTGILDTLYFAAFALAQIPCGYLLDRFGGRIVLSLSAFCCTVGLLIFATAPTFSMALLGRTLSGLGAAGGLLGSLYIINKYWPQRFLALGLGLAIMLGLAGGLFGTPLAWVAEHFGWRSLILLLAIIAFVIALSFLLFLKDSPHAQAPKPWSACKAIFLNPSFWFIAVYGALLYTPTGTLGSFWGIEYLKIYFHEQYNLLVASMVAMIFLGWMLGSPLSGWFSDRLQQRRSIILAGGFLTLFSLFLIGFTYSLPPFFVYAVFLLLGLSSAASGLTFAMGCDIAPPHSGGITIAFINMIAILPTIFVTPLFGAILDHFWTGRSLAGARIYSLTAYQNAMILEYAIVGLALVIGFFFLKESVSVAKRAL